MDKIRQGKTNLLTGRISSAACLPIQLVDRESAVAVARQACDQGINFFDTARAYTTSEADLDQAFVGLGDRVIAATKSYYENNMLRAKERDHQYEISNPT